MKCSVVIPCYCEETTLPGFWKELCPVLNDLSSRYNIVWEVIFVDDGSKDDTLQFIKELANKVEWVSYIAFSRNFGKEAALYAGLQDSTGDYVTIMDADLQDPPNLLPEMYRRILEDNYDGIAAKRCNREGEAVVRSAFAKLFYKIMNAVSSVDIPDGARDFRTIKRSIVDAFLQVEEYNRFSKGIFSWEGFRIGWLEYTNAPRKAGNTKWSFLKLITYAIDGIVAFSTIPLVLASVLGILLCIIALIFIIIIVIQTILYGNPVAGWASLTTIIIFLSGIQLMFMGIIGIYISRIYLETKKRPLFIIKEKN